MTSRPTVLITGATDGIGLELARIYRARGAQLVLVGRRSAEALDPAEYYCRVDLAQPYAAMIVAEFVQQQGIPHLDLLIHNAGIGSYGPVEEQTPEQIDRLLDTNLCAPISLTHALLPYLAAARGRVVCIGSVAAALPAPEYAVYGATKAALEGFARNLRIELHGQVAVQVIHPGATRTGMHAKVGAPLERIGWRRFPTADAVADQIVAAIDRGAPVAVIGAGNRLLRFAGRFAGTLVDRVVMQRSSAV
jgi:short-subunit dehydrogenase